MIALARRRTELGLILLGALVTAGAYALAALGRTATLPADIGPFLVMVLALLVTAHLATRRFAPGADGLLLPLAALLNGIGYVFIARLDEAKADPSGLAGLQSVWTALGVGAYIVTLLVVRRARDLARLRYSFLLLGVALLLLPLVPVVGQTVNGARIWVALGPVGFQPGEFGKIALAVFFAGYLVENREALGLRALDLRELAPVLVAWGISLVVMFFERDLGSSLLFFALFVVLLWVATGRALYLGLGGALFAGGAFLAYRVFNHVQERVATWYPFWELPPDPTGDGFQITQSWFAMAWGGIGGTGLGLGNPQRIPVVETDFIFAAIGEELGLFGTTAIIVGFLLLASSGLRVAARTEDPFDKLLATGLTTLLAIQAFIIMAGVTKLLPLTGVTLPFVSYGGSSLLGNYVLLALLVRISDDAARRRGELPEPRARRWRRSATAPDPADAP
ncbi:MAG: FtsW/RodA/SpoVE family cell cycle protein [Acidimicrobiia bacterium]|nr:FtsW/RodA/SpoVE family cell cycle protein [Acidimicrobiia bacterium]